LHVGTRPHLVRLKQPLTFFPTPLDEYILFKAGDQFQMQIGCHLRAIAEKKEFEPGVPLDLRR
jgi:hypothetical protein